MEELNNSQLILLAILVSFVTSITTGVLTVSLLTEDSPTVTQTINRVVERTIETVVPGETKTVVKEVPVVVTEEELIVKVVNSAIPAVVPLALSANKDHTLGLGFILDDGVHVITSSLILPGGNSKDRGPYTLTLEDGGELMAELVKVSAEADLAVLKVTKSKPPRGESANILTELLTPSSPPVKGVKIGSSELLVGQTVIALGSTDAEASPVTVGIVSSLVTARQSTSTVAIKTNAADSHNLGGPLFNIQGEVVAVNIKPGLAVPAQLAQVLLGGLE